MFTWDANTSYSTLYETFAWELPPRLNMGVVCSNDQRPDALALIELRKGEAQEYTFGDLTRLSNRLANGLQHELGIGPGDRVAVMLSQGLDCGVAHLAIYKLGAIAVPLTQLFGPYAVRFRLSDSGARAVITDSRCQELVTDIAADIGGVSVILTDETSPPAPLTGMASLVQGGSDQFDAYQTGPDDPALIIYTSGTTGSPKGALHGHRVLWGHLPGFELSSNFCPQPHDRVWTPADWAWIGGLLDVLLPAWSHGRPMIAAPRNQFEPSWAFDLITEHQVSVSFLPPTALKMMRQTGKRLHDASLRAIISGGEPLGSEILHWGKEYLGATINEIYGQTEVNLVAGSCEAAWSPKPGSIGKPYPGHRVAILGSDGSFAQPGETGEIVVAWPDPVMMLNYWNNQPATDKKFVELPDAASGSSQWFRTGDVASFDDDGYLWFTARGDDVILSRGYRIGPGEIEECLLTHPAVALTAVIGVPDETRGQAVKSFVQLRPDWNGSDELADDLKQHVRSRLASYQYPQIVEFVDQLPMTTTGKIKRQQLREQHS